MSVYCSLCSAVRSAGVACPYSSSPFLACVQSAIPALQSGPVCWCGLSSELSAPPAFWALCLWSSPIVRLQSLVISCSMSAVSGLCLQSLDYVCSLWSSPVLCSQSLVIFCTVSAVSGHPLCCVRSLWSSPVLCLQSLVISCTVSTVSGHLLYCVRSLWSFPVLCPQSLVIS
ncbi:unnamed protein product, partial [Staurois parvus]